MRLGCLPYLNVKPLVYRFERNGLPQGWELVYEPPAKLAQMLLDGELSAAPVSSFACLAWSDLAAVPGVCIASEGAVSSVLMLSKVEPHRVRSVAADTSSLSGRSYLRIILKERFGIKPEFVSRPPNVDDMLALHDGALIIGNPAMLADKTGLHVVDIGEEWMNLTGLPAVFAVWAGGSELLTSELVEALQSAKIEGMTHVEEIAQEESVHLGLSYDTCYDYLHRIMRYDLGEREIESLKVFGEKLMEHGVINSAPELKLVESREQDSKAHNR